MPPGADLFSDSLKVLEGIETRVVHACWTCRREEPVRVQEAKSNEVVVVCGLLKEGPRVVNHDLHRWRAVRPLWMGAEL